MKIYETCTDCEDGTRHFDNSESIAVAVKCAHCEEGKIEVEPDVLAKEFAEWLDESLWTKNALGWYNSPFHSDYKSINDLFTQFLKEKGYETEN